MPDFIWYAILTWTWYFIRPRLYYLVFLYQEPIGSGYSAESIDYECLLGWPPYDSMAPFSCPLITPLRPAFERGPRCLASPMVLIAID
jgi:hypothetical protein